MASCHHPELLLSKSIHVDIEDPAATDLLLSDWSLLISYFDVEADSNVHHLFAYGIGPKGVVIFLVKCPGLRDIAWHTDSQLVGLLDHTPLDGITDAISLFEGVIYP